MTSSVESLTTPTLLSHRGYWIGAAERNTEAAFRRSWQAGFGLETDVRDLDGTLVISHDPPRAGTLTLEQFLAWRQALGPDLPLALNVKSDGIEGLLQAALRRHAAGHWFVFDMSVPDTLRYRAAGMPYFTRHSDHEATPALYPDAAGVWLDAFERDWLDRASLARHLASGKSVVIVSPELHGRAPEPFWAELGRWCATPFQLAGQATLGLCTDHPERARDILLAARKERHHG
jgi:hypothetical protein